MENNETNKLSIDEAFRKYAREVGISTHKAAFKAGADQAKQQPAGETIELNINDFCVNMNDVERSFAAGILASGISLADMVKMNMVEKFEWFKRDYLDDKGYDPEVLEEQQPVREKTLDEIKDEVAKEYGYECWHDIMRDHGMHGCNIETYMTDVALLYAYSKAVETPWKPCGEGDNICNCKNASECGYIEFYMGVETQQGWIHVSNHPDRDIRKLLVFLVGVERESDITFGSFTEGSFKYSPRDPRGEMVIRYYMPLPEPPTKTNN